MHVSDILKQRKVSCSFEFFPPKTPKGADTLFNTISKLQQHSPSFVSVTYGAGGSTRDLTHELVVRIKRTTQLEAIPHLTCVCHGEAEVRDILTRYAEAGVDNILALGGDPPKQLGDYDRSSDAFQHASELVEFIAGFNRGGSHTQARGFGIGVAGFPEGHPGTPNRLEEMDHLKEKIDAGADYICTQLFFDNRDFFDFCERCAIAGINVPVIAGIMPITTRKGMKRMADLAAGARFPAALQRLVSSCDDEVGVAEAGVDWATQQCVDLIKNGVRGIHFYTLNKSDSTLRILQNVDLSRP